jgi:Flp pilus assembly protein TadG
MIQSQAQSVRRPYHRSRKGMVLIYAMVAMTTFCAFASLAVDYGHVQVVDFELQRAADAAALAGAQSLPSGTAGAIGAATTVASENLVDNNPINPSKVTVQLINWTSATNYTVVSTASAANAVRVSISNGVPLLYASLLGFPSHLATRSTIAERVVQSATQFVSTHSNPWLAGEPLGTQASDPDPGWKGQNVSKEHPWQFDLAGPASETNSEGESYESPVQVGISIVPGATITVTSVSGMGNNDFTQSAQYDATGNANGYEANYDDEASNGVAEHGISDTTMPLNALNAVFLNNSAPDSNIPPSTLNFSSQSERDYASGTNNGQVANSGQFDPKVQQVFYVGNGKTSAGTQQTVVVPPGATRLFLGTMDGHEWSNNEGGFTATINQTYVEIVN